MPRRISRSVDGNSAAFPLQTIDSAQGNLLLSFHPSIGSSTQNQTNPTQILIKVLNAFATSTNAQRPSEAGSADSGVVLGKKMKEEEYYLAIWANGDDGTGEVSSAMAGSEQGTRSLGLTMRISFSLEKS
jgi:hypothetical protein